MLRRAPRWSQFIFQVFEELRGKLFGARVQRHIQHIVYQIEALRCDIVALHRLKRQTNSQHTLETHDTLSAPNSSTEPQENYGFHDLPARQYPHSGLAGGKVASDQDHSHFFFVALKENSPGAL